MRIKPRKIADRIKEREENLIEPPWERRATKKTTKQKGEKSSGKTERKRRRRARKRVH